MLAAATGQPMERITRDASRTFYMDAQQAIEYGMADKVLQKEKVPMAQVAAMPPAVAATARGIQ